MKFSVGEVVVYVGPYTPWVGSDVKIHIAGPVEAFTRDRRIYRCTTGPSDYVIWNGEYHMFVQSHHLRKRPYKDQHAPAAQSFPELISWANGQSEWTPKTKQEKV